MAVVSPPVARPIVPGDVGQQPVPINAVMEAASTGTATHSIDRDGLTTTALQITSPDGHTTTTTSRTTPPIQVPPLSESAPPPQEDIGTSNRHIPIITPLPVGGDPTSN